MHLASILTAASARPPKWIKPQVDEALAKSTVSPALRCDRKRKTSQQRWRFLILVVEVGLESQGEHHDYG
jgi:hypothetical protein